MLLSCGDALVDFLPVTSIDGRDAAVPVAGGSCLNIAVGMARLGAPAGFVGGISTDLFGRIVADHALTSEVDLRYATRSAHQTTLAFVRHVGGEPHYAFYDEATAARNWIYRTGSIPFGEIEAIHVGSTTLANDEGAAQALAMIEDAAGATTISFDPNCRPNLVRDKARYVARRHAGLVEVDAPAIDVVDTIGAGDSFQAALLFALRAIGRIKRETLAQMNAGELDRALSFASACAAVTCGRAGADPPRQSDVGPALSRLLVG